MLRCLSVSSPRIVGLKPPLLADAKQDKNVLATPFVAPWAVCEGPFASTSPHFLDHNIPTAKMHFCIVGPDICVCPSQRESHFQATSITVPALLQDDPEHLRRGPLQSLLAAPHRNRLQNTSLQNRLNSQLMQRAGRVVIAGIRSASTISRISASAILICSRSLAEMTTFCARRSGIR